MSRLSDTTFPNPFFLAVKMRCITSMGIKIFTIDVAGQCDALRCDKMTKFQVYNYSESFYLPHLLKYTTFWVSYMSRISKNPSTSHHLEGKSKSGSFYPPIGVWYTTFRNRYFPKYLGNEFDSVNHEIL